MGGIKICFDYFYMTLNQLIDLLRKAFSDDEIKKGVLDEEWYKKNIESKIDST